MIILMDTEKSFVKIDHLLMIKLNKLEIKENFFHLRKVICIKNTLEAAWIVPQFGWGSGKRV